MAWPGSLDDRPSQSSANVAPSATCPAGDSTLEIARDVLDSLDRSRGQDDPNVQAVFDRRISQPRTVVTFDDIAPANLTPGSVDERLIDQGIVLEGISGTTLVGGSSYSGPINGGGLTVSPGWRTSRVRVHFVWPGTRQPRLVQQVGAFTTTPDRDRNCMEFFGQGGASLGTGCVQSGPYDNPGEFLGAASGVGMAYIDITSSGIPYELDLLTFSAACGEAPDRDGDGVGAEDDCDDDDAAVGALLYDNGFESDTGWFATTPQLDEPWTYDGGAVEAPGGGQQAMLGSETGWRDVVVYATLSSAGSWGGCCGNEGPIHRWRSGVLLRAEPDGDQEEGFHGYRCALASNAESAGGVPHAGPSTGHFLQLAAFLDGPEDDNRSECEGGPNTTFDELARAEHDIFDLTSGDDARMTFRITGDTLSCELEYGDQAVRVTAEDSRFGQGTIGLSTLNMMGRFHHIRVCEALPESGDPPPQPAGRVFYLSNSSGTIEVWSVADDGSDPVRHTEGLSNSPSTTNPVRPIQARVSWDGQCVAVVSPRRSDGTYDGRDGHIWHLNVDGSDFRHVAGIHGSGDGVSHGFDWEGDSRHLIFADRVVCSPNLHRIDASVADAAGADVVGDIQARIRTINPRYLIGTGKLDEIRALADQTDAELILVEHPLTPAQERNLEKQLGRRVVDRTGLILDIFALRARSFEGKLQVELAQLEHLSTRLVRGWTHLERQKGGIGLRGPGETQLETDRRLLGNRIRQLKSRLERLTRRRGLARQQRTKREIPTVSLVGYTNAGKSTLFNRLSGADVEVADQLFATLDPTLRRVELPSGGPIVLADTVGFVRDLPHELVEAFRSTLEETRKASLLLHVVDSSDPERRERTDDVMAVLREIGADKIPLVQVYNKADILDVPPRIDRAESGLPRRVWLSATTGAGLDILLNVITDYLRLDVVSGTVMLSVSESRLRALLYERATVVSERVLSEGGWEIDVEMDRRAYQDLKTNENLRIRAPA